MTTVLKEQAPRVELREIHRLSENGDGAVQWGLETDFTLAEVTAPGFFRGGGKHGFKKNDRVYVVCEQHRSVVEHAVLVVTVSRVGGSEWKQIGESHRVGIGTMTPFERLGVEPTANKNQIDDAFRERAKRLHPDKGGDKNAMQELNKARDEATLIADHKEQAA